MSECELCGLPTPTRPVERDGGEFCCRGCADVYETLGDVETTELDSERSSDTEGVPDGEEAYLTVEGMHCSSCEAMIERTMAAKPGILDAESSYATETAKVVYDPEEIDESELPGALDVAGYSARLRDADGPDTDMSPREFLRMLVAAGSLMLVMMVYIAYYYPVYLGFIDPHGVGGIAPFATVYFPGIVVVGSTMAVFYVGFPILQSASVGIRTGLPNMDLLIAVAVLAAYTYSLLEVARGGIDLYFDVATVITVVVTAGRYYEATVKRQSTNDLTETIANRVETARIRHNGDVRDVPVEDVSAGDEVVVREGEHVPLDGTVIEGRAAVNEALLTGEPVPAVKAAGDDVIGGSVVEENALVIEVGDDAESTLDRLARILWEVQSTTPGVQKIADRMATAFVPAVMAVAGIAVAWQLATGGAVGGALRVGLATLIVACPCALGLATPLAVAAGTSAGLDRSIVVTSADAFERTSEVDVVAMDKTGTLSRSEMGVAEVIGDDDVVARAAAVERYSTHPIATAIADLPTDLDATAVETHPGEGVVGTVEKRRVAVGAPSLFESLEWSVPDDLQRDVEALPADLVVSLVGWDGRARGAIATRDVGRSAWRETVATLRERATEVVLLTGDDDARGFDEAVDEAYVGLPPEAKAATIRRLQAEGRVGMIGDGSNDAPALAAADLGIAFGDPTTLAAEAGDVVVMDEDLRRVVEVFDILCSTRSRIRQNLGWAFLYNAIAIPVAVAGLINPLLAAVAMSASSLLVVGNSARRIGGSG